MGSEFGPGIALYFRLLIFLGIVFFLYALAASPWVAVSAAALLLLLLLPAHPRPSHFRSAGHRVIRFRAPPCSTTSARSTTR